MMEALRRQKRAKAEAEMAKLKKINRGGGEYLKQQRREEKSAKLNKNIQGFHINE